MARREFSRAIAVCRSMKAASATSVGRPTRRQLLPPSDRDGACEKAVLRTATAIMLAGKNMAHLGVIGECSRSLGIETLAMPTMSSIAAILGVISNHTKWSGVFTRGTNTTAQSSAQVGRLDVQRGRTECVGETAILVVASVSGPGCKQRHAC